MDVVTPEQARIAEDAGACAVMALERVPADIRRDGGVARMSDPEMIEGIEAAVTIPVMAKARIGHFVEAQILAGARRRLRRRERGAHPGRRGPPHRQVGVRRAVRVRRHQPRRGAAAHLRGRGDDPLQGRGRHRQHRRGRPPPALDPRRHPQASPRPTRPSCSTGPSACRPRCRSCRRSPRPAGSRSRCSAPAASPRPADAALAMQLGAEAVFVGSGIFKSDDPSPRAKAIVEATTHFQRRRTSWPRSAAASGAPMTGHRDGRGSTEQLRRARLVATVGVKPEPPGAARPRIGVLALQGAFAAHTPPAR